MEAPLFAAKIAVVSFASPSQTLPLGWDLPPLRIPHFVFTGGQALPPFSFSVPRR